MPLINPRSSAPEVSLCLRRESSDLPLGSHALLLLLLLLRVLVVVLALLSVLQLSVLLLLQFFLLSVVCLGHEVEDFTPREQLPEACT